MAEQIPLEWLLDHCHCQRRFHKSQARVHLGYAKIGGLGGKLATDTVDRESALVCRWSEAIADLEALIASSKESPAVEGANDG